MKCRNWKDKEREKGQKRMGEKWGRTNMKKEKNGNRKERGREEKRKEGNKSMSYYTVRT